MHIFADGFSKISLSNNNLRITLIQKGPDNTTLEAGILIIPTNQAGNFLNSLAGSLKNLDEQIKAQARQTQGETQ